MSNFNPGNYYRNIDRYGSEIVNEGAPDFNPTPVNYTPVASGNTQNINEFVIDPNGDMYFIDADGESFKINTNSPLDVLTTAQPTPTATGNTTNLNSVFVDTTGEYWVVDWKGDAIKVGPKDIVTTVTNTVTGNKIATYTNELGAVVDINETITVLGNLTYDPVTGLLTIPYTDEAGIVNNKTATIASLNVLTTAQPTPTATGNTTNLNSAFKDAAGNTWVVDANGDAVQAGNAPFKNLNEWHVDPNGSDTTGDGSQEKPFATITKAVSVAGQGDQIIVHAGVYTENVTISTPNVSLVGAQSDWGSLSQINGSVTVSASGTSVKISDITVGSIVDTGSGDLYLNNMTVGSTVTSSAGYLEIKNSRIQDAAITKSGGKMLIENSKIDNVDVTGVNTAAVIRDSYQDGNSTITFGAGTVYGINNVQGGEITINVGAVPLETAALAQGLSAEMAKEAETADFQKLGMIRPDTEASPTKVVTWDEVTGRLEVSDVSALGSQGAPVTVGTNTPTGTSIEGAIHLVTDDGTPTGTVLEQYIYDSDSGVWIEMQRNAQDTLKFGIASPTANGEWDGEEYFVTSNGQHDGAVLEQWIWDKQSTSWIQRPTPVAELTTTSLTPKVYQSTSFVNAQANLDANVADLIQLSDGSYVHDGKITWTGHGLTVGAWYYLSQSAAGGYTTVKPTSGLVQQLFFVEDANTIHVDIEEAWTVGGTTSGQEFAQTVYFNSTNPSSATIFDLENPPATNDDALKADSSNIYIGSDNSTWTYDSVAGQYETYVIPTNTKLALSYYIPARTITANVASILTNLTLRHNNIPTTWNNSTGTFTAPTTGYYLVTGQLLSGGGVPLGGFFALDVLKNGVADVRWFEQSQVASSGILTATGAQTVFLNAGNTLQFRGFCTATTGTNNLNIANYISISQL